MTTGIDLSLQALTRIAWGMRLNPSLYFAARKMTYRESTMQKKMEAIVDSLHRHYQLNRGYKPLMAEMYVIDIDPMESQPLDADDACVLVAAAAMSVGIRCRIIGLRFGQSWTCHVQYEVGDHWETIDPLRQHTDRVPDELVTGPDPEDPQR